MSAFRPPELPELRLLPPSRSNTDGAPANVIGSAVDEVQKIARHAASRAAVASPTSAARHHENLFTAIEIPMPLPQTAIPRAAASPRIARASFAP